jgi:hypothetical protein
MSSLTKQLSEHIDSAESHGPDTPLGNQCSPQNAIRNGLFAQCIVLENESQEAFNILLADYMEHFQPADGVEHGIVEEMVASVWRLRRSWAIETRMFDRQIAGPDIGARMPKNQPAGGLPSGADPEKPLNPRSVVLDRMTNAYNGADGLPSMALMHRYETRLHMMYQRALHNLLVSRSARMQNESSRTSKLPNQITTQTLHHSPSSTKASPKLNSPEPNPPERA